MTTDKATDKATEQSVTEPLMCEAATASEQGPCENQEDAALVVCLPDRWMIAVADGCSGGPDKGAAAAAAVEAAETAWRDGEHGDGPEPDIAAMFAAADKAVLAIPCGDLAANREKADTYLKQNLDPEWRDADEQAEMLQTVIGRGAMYHPEHRDTLLPLSVGPGFWGPATTLTVAVWDREQGLRWGVCGDSWLFAVDKDETCIALETPRLDIQRGGCLGFATPRPVYGHVPDIDGWMVFAATDGLYPALGEYEEAVLTTIEQAWRDTHHDVNRFLSALFAVAETYELFDNTTGAAVKIPA